MQKAPYINTPPILGIPAQIDTSNPADDSISCSGYCNSCKKEHHLYSGAARQYCINLMDTLSENKRIDLCVSDEEADPQFSTDYLFGKARGQMFGVMVYQSQNGLTGVIPAFSGQYNGNWHVDGWVPPLFDVDQFHQTTFAVEKEIKRLGRKINAFAKGSAVQKKNIQQRKTLSRRLMKEIHGIYRLGNFKGETCSIFEAFIYNNGIPTGTGDCCAPKLLNHAAKNDLTPLSIAEFYWGKENRSNTRHHGQFYSSCQDKCAPILGFLLCGLSNQDLCCP